MNTKLQCFLNTSCISFVCENGQYKKIVLVGQRVQPEDKEKAEGNHSQMRKAHSTSAITGHLLINF